MTLAHEVWRVLTLTLPEPRVARLCGLTLFRWAEKSIALPEETLP
jgi:hypothetical protein